MSLQETGRDPDIRIAEGESFHRPLSAVRIEDPRPHTQHITIQPRDYLTFRDIALADAAAEFNRYSEQKIFIQDPTVAAIRLSGKVRPTSFEGFVRLLEDAFPIRVEHVEGWIVLIDARASGGRASATQ